MKVKTKKKITPRDVVVRVYDKYPDGQEMDRAIHKWSNASVWTNIYLWLWGQHGKTDLLWVASFNGGQTWSKPTSFMKWTF